MAIATRHTASAAAATTHTATCADPCAHGVDVNNAVPAAVPRTTAIVPEAARTRLKASRQPLVALNRCTNLDMFAMYPSRRGRGPTSRPENPTPATATSPEPAILDLVAIAEALSPVQWASLRGIVAMQTSMTDHSSLVAALGADRPLGDEIQRTVRGDTICKGAVAIKAPLGDRQRIRLVAGAGPLHPP
jgi:hypothetical protein